MRPYAVAIAIAILIFVLLLFMGDSIGLGWILNTRPYPARWYCGQWSAKIGWLYIASDFTVWLAYMGIPTLLLYLIRNRPEIPFRPIFFLFSAFILSCGTTHLMDAIIFWWPAYGLAAVFKLITAVVSVATLIALIQIVPKALQLRGPEALTALVDEKTAQLKIANQMVGTIIQSSPLGMLMVDGHGKILMTNRAVTLLFGYEESDIIGNRVEMFLPESFGTDHIQLRDNYFKSPERRSLGLDRSLYGIAKDGMSVPISIDLTPVEYSGGTGVLATILDLRELKEREESLRALNRDLEMSNRDLEQFAYVASHDLQEPLRKISAYSELFMMDYGAKLDDDGKQLMQAMQDGAKRSKALVSELLTFARVSSEAGEHQLCRVETCVQEALNALELQIKESEAEIEVGEMPEVVANASQLALVFQNLISNAIKYQEPGSIPNIKIESSQGSGVFQFTVTDNGLGIAEDDLEKVFEIFQRVHTGTEYKGSGIGLALCRRIIDKHDGTISVKSSLGQGSTFLFTLPKRE